MGSSSLELVTSLPQVVMVEAQMPPQTFNLMPLIWDPRVLIAPWVPVQAVEVASMAQVASATQG